MTQPATYISKEKQDELRIELDYLSSTKRKEIAEALEFAKSLGDLSENAEYHQAREEQARTEDRIAQVEIILKDAIVVTEHKGPTVQMGSKVELKKKSDKSVRVCTLVGSQESDVPTGKISNESPLGAALLGKKKGDVVSVRTPDNSRVEYEITKVE